MAEQALKARPGWGSQNF